MPPRQNSIAAILRQSEFNGALGTGPWVAIPGLFSMTSASVTKPPLVVGGPTVIFNGNQGLLLKVFLNTQTGEVRTYLAKSLSDDPEGSLI